MVLSFPSQRNCFKEPYILSASAYSDLEKRREETTIESLVHKKKKKRSKKKEIKFYDYGSRSKIKMPKY